MAIRSAPMPCGTKPIWWLVSGSVARLAADAALGGCARAAQFVVRSWPLCGRPGRFGAQPAGARWTVTGWAPSGSTRRPRRRSCGLPPRRPSRPIVRADSRLAPPVGLSTRPLDTVSTGLQTNRLSIGQTTINSHTWFKVRNIERLLMCNISRSDLACTICVSYATKTLRCVADHSAALTAMHVTPMAAPCHPGRCRLRGHSEGEVGQRWSHQELALLSTTSSQIPFRG